MPASKEKKIKIIDKKKTKIANSKECNSNSVNMHRVLVLTSRGISYRDRHLLNDLKSLMPQHKSEPKLERWKTLAVINEIATSRNCDKAILFEGRRKRDLYMWLANTTEGPSVKFALEDINTMSQLKLIGNCMKGSRAIMSFDQNFNQKQHLMLIKELLIQIFNVPKGHPQSKPFFDRAYTFTYLDNKIWFRHFQLLTEEAVIEIGPRFVMNPIKIFENSFSGLTLWKNQNYISSTAKRRKLLQRTDYVKNQKDLSGSENYQNDNFNNNNLNAVFQNDNFRQKARKYIQEN